MVVRALGGIIHCVAGGCEGVIRGRGDVTGASGGVTGVRMLSGALTNVLGGVPMPGLGLRTGGVLFTKANVTSGDTWCGSVAGAMRPLCAGARTTIVVKMKVADGINDSFGRGSTRPQTSRRP